MGMSDRYIVVRDPDLFAVDDTSAQIYILVDTIRRVVIWRGDNRADAELAKRLTVEANNAPLVQKRGIR